MTLCKLQVCCKNDARYWNDAHCKNGHCAIHAMCHLNHQCNVTLTVIRLHMEIVVKPTFAHLVPPMYCLSVKCINFIMQIRRRAVLVYLITSKFSLLPPSCDSIQCFVRSILSVSECRCEELNFLRIFEDQQIGMLLRRFYAVWQVDGVFVEVNAH